MINWIIKRSLSGSGRILTTKIALATSHVIGTEKLDDDVMLAKTTYIKETK